MTTSAVYEGWVRHRRFAPTANAFRYRLYLLYLDLAEVESVFRGRTLWSSGRPNLAWFRRADYLGPTDLPLDEAVRRRVEEVAGRRPSGPIRLLTQVRTWGYLFNPASFYYVLAPDGTALETVVVDITNTPWKERHAYVLDARSAEVRGGVHRHRLAKTFHVSPFMPMDVRYDWRFSAPGERVLVHMANERDGRVIFDATLSLRRRELDAAALRRCLVAYPGMTFKVSAAIYWQALRLWAKRTPFHPHPRARTTAPETAS